MKGTEGGVFTIVASLVIALVALSVIWIVLSKIFGFSAGLLLGATEKYLCENAVSKIPGGKAGATVGSGAVGLVTGGVGGCLVGGAIGIVGGPPGMAAGCALGAKIGGAIGGVGGLVAGTQIC